jgi:hypothetical protein
MHRVAKALQTGATGLIHGTAAEHHARGVRYLLIDGCRCFKEGDYVGQYSSAFCRLR